MVASEFVRVVVEMNIVLLAVPVLLEFVSVVLEIVVEDAGLFVSSEIHLIKSTLISFLLAVIQLLPSTYFQSLVISSTSPYSFKAAILG